MIEITEIEAENRRRHAARFAPLPDPLAAQRGVTHAVRFKRDFEFWAATCVKIKDKLSGRIVPFVLNRAQRRVLAILESQRTAEKPIRLIMLKARQWGGSTLVQIYMAWIQMIHLENWHSLICAHVKDTANTIRAMYSTLLANYPERYADSPLKFTRFEDARNTRVIAHRGCRVTLCSSENPEAAHGGDYAMAHLSEVAFWADTPQRTPEALVRAICGSVARAPLTLIVMESTANGPGNFFYHEWERATSEKGSDKTPVFVPWHEIDIYTEPLHCPTKEFFESLDDYERELWEQGLTLEQINWYKNKRREYSTHQQMKADYPTTAIEAFANSSNPVFNPAHVEALKPGLREPLTKGELQGDEPTGVRSLKGLRLLESPAGALSVWELPAPPGQLTLSPEYLVAVDVGGRSESADWSVIAVGRVTADGRIEIVAQWRGHIDHDLLAWKAAAIAKWYDNALLIVESNTLESHGNYVLEKLSPHYRNLYRRRCRATASDTLETRFGFHTNVMTKGAAIDELTAMLRDGMLTERSADAVAEFATYIRKPGGPAEAAPGCHDDILMTRAIMAYVLNSEPPRRAKRFAISN